MTEDKMGWIDAQEKKNQENSQFFTIQEGDNRIQILTHAAPIALKWTGAKYEPADFNDDGVSIKGMCYVLQDGNIKEATLPYTVVKQIRALQNDPDYEFSMFPMPRQINIKAKGAGTKEVEYTVIPSPKETEVPADILTALSEKPTPEELAEKSRPTKDEVQNPEDIPF